MSQFYQVDNEKQFMLDCAVKKQWQSHIATTMMIQKVLEGRNMHKLIK